MPLADNVRPIREAGMSDAPDQQTPQLSDREDWRTRRTMVEHDVLATKSLTWTEKGIYIALQSHCYVGKTVCWPSVATLADHTGLAARVVTRAVGSLERKGWLAREVGGGTQTTRYILHGDPGGTPDKCSPPTPVIPSPPPCHTVTTPLTNRHHPPDKSSDEAVQNKQYKISSTKESIVVVSSAPAEQSARTAQNDELEHRALALCAEIRIPPTPPALKAMGIVIRDFAGTAPRPLEDLAVDAADWFERHPKRQRTVSFFRGWIKREYPGSPPTAVVQSNGHGNAPPSAETDEKAAARQSFRQQRLERNAEKARAFGRSAGQEPA